MQSEAATLESSDASVNQWKKIQSLNTSTLLFIAACSPRRLILDMLGMQPVGMTLQYTQKFAIRRSLNAFLSRVAVWCARLLLQYSANIFKVKKLRARPQSYLNTCWN